MTVPVLLLRKLDGQVFVHVSFIFPLVEIETIRNMIEEVVLSPFILCEIAITYIGALEMSQLLDESRIS